MQTYYHLHTNTMDPCSMSKDAAAAARESWLCTGCSFPKPETTSVDVKVQGLGPEDGPLNLVYGFGVALATKSFVASFDKSAVQRDLRLGRVFLENGREIGDWVTVRPRRMLIVRGTKKVAHRQCSECGRNIYFAMGSRYVYPPPPLEHEIFESDLSGLIVSQRIFEAIVLNRWLKLVIDKLPVLNVPKDGLPDLVSTYSPLQK